MFTSLRLNRTTVVCLVVFIFVITSSASDSSLTGPSGFRFDGNWNCEGNFVGSGKTHRSTYEGRSLQNGWIELVETDIEPKGYIAHYLLSEDKQNKEIVELDTNNAGYAIYKSPGWQDQKLILTHTGEGNYKVPMNRFVFEVVSADAFNVTWEIEKEKNWAASDRLSCKRSK